MESKQENESPQLKTNQNKRKTKAKLSKEQILLALKKKKECNERAQRIVEELLDPVPMENISNFKSNLAHINPSHYDDIIEERAIEKLCGYPLCDIELEDVPKQQYRISGKLNKVYDITVRKCFCSTKCYKSSEYLKEQLLITPLWIRREDDKIPEFKFLKFD